jgi:23S rRNA (adenine2503-C2)-methyltransferase
MEPLNLKEAMLEELEALASSLGEPSYRATQIAQWVYQKGATSPEEMTNLSKALRDRLSEATKLPALEVLQREESSDGTVKYLFGLTDGEAIEAVVIPEGKRLTLCLSTQVGCRFSCSFCRTAEMGLRRQLETWEIVDQYLACRLRLGHPITNLVFMGMGEPLDNYGPVTKALRIMTDEGLMQISPRRITVSTVGLTPAIKALMDEGLGVNLAVSLVATTDEVRNDLTPVGKRYGLENLFGTLRALELPKRRRITIEYVLLEGLNDSTQDAHRLAHLLHGLKCKVNIIPFNPYPGSALSRPDDDRVHHFVEALAAKGYTTTVRASRGTDILAACGHLAVEQPTLVESRKIGQKD